MRAIDVRRRLHMTGCTLQRRVMVLVGVTGEAQGPGRSQLGDAARGMTGIACLMSRLGRLVSRRQPFGGVTDPAGTILLMMLVVTRDATEHCRIGCHTHRLRMALDTMERGVALMVELDGTRSEERRVGKE